MSDNQVSDLNSVDNAIERASKIKLRGGLVGKLSLVLIFMIIAVGSIASTIGNVWVGLVGIAAIFILVAWLGNRMVSFANENPQAALFDGAEFLMHERLKMEMKSGLTFDHDPSKAMNDPGTLLEGSDVKAIDPEERE